MNSIITHNESRRIFEMQVEGYLASVTYQIEGNTFDIVSTFVPKEIEGRGIASIIVKAAHNYAITNGFQCKGSCSYAALWLERHNIKSK